MTALLVNGPYAGESVNLPPHVRSIMRFDADSNEVVYVYDKLDDELGVALFSTAVTCRP